MYKETKDRLIASRDSHRVPNEYVLDESWSAAISLRKSIPTRCPFASVDLCPRYFLSLSLLGQSGITTNIVPQEEERLEAKWKSHPLWPRTAEQGPGVGGSGGKPAIFSHFCPEVIYDTFGVFASSLSEYPDELDRDLAHQSLGRRHAPIEMIGDRSGQRQPPSTTLTALLMHRCFRNLVTGAPRRKTARYLSLSRIGTASALIFRFCGKG